MELYKKRPLETRAFQWKGGGDLRELSQVFETIKDGTVRIRAKKLIIEKSIPVSDGEPVVKKLQVDTGDWLLVSAEGKVSSLTGDDFIAMYEPVNPPAQAEIEDLTKTEGEANGGEPVAEGEPVDPVPEGEPVDPVPASASTSRRKR